MEAITILAATPFMASGYTLVLMMTVLGIVGAWVLSVLDSAQVAYNLADEHVYQHMDLAMVHEPVVVEQVYQPSPGRRLRALLDGVRELAVLTVCQTVESLVDTEWDLSERPTFDQQLRQLMEEWDIQLRRLDAQGQAMAALIARAQV